MREKENLCLTKKIITIDMFLRGQRGCCAFKNVWNNRSVILVKELRNINTSHLEPQR